MDNLDSMNPKQQLKEYKATQKEIKSKEIAVKTIALKKFEDIRYLTEGGCLVPFINSILPKKKTLDVSQLCLEHLQLFIEKRKNDSIQETPIILALNSVLSTEGNLVVLKVLSDSIIFYEEIKKPKKKKAKKGEIVEDDPPIKEDPNYEIIRRNALKSLYSIVKDLYANTNSSDMIRKLQLAFSKIDNIVNHLCQLLINLKIKFTSENSEEQFNSIQDGIYALMILTFAIRHNSETITWLVKYSDLIHVLFELANIEQFTFSCIQIFEIISTHTDGIKYLQSASDNQRSLLTLLEKATTNLLKANELINSVPATGKDAKKDDKNKKGVVVEEVIDPFASLDCIKIDPVRNALASIKLISKVFTVLGSQLNTIMNDDTVIELVQLISKSLITPLVYKIMRDEFQAPFDEPLDDTLDHMCVLFGTLGLMSSPIRCQTYSSGALVSLFKVLIDSKGIINGNLPSTTPSVVATGGGGNKGSTVPPVVENVVLEGDELLKQIQRIHKLRRVVEKAILNLLTESLESPLDDVEAGHVSHGLELSVRWTSCFTRKTDDHPFNIPELNLANNLLTIISTYDKDIDLANRGIRILAAMLHGHPHPVELIESKEIQKLLTSQISLLIDHRALEIISTLVAKDRQALNLLTDTTNIENDLPTEVFEDVPTSEAILVVEDTTNSNQIVESSTAIDDVLIPTIEESLYLALSVMELFLMSTTPDTINSFATVARVDILSDLLKSSGPINSSTSTNFGSTLNINNIISSQLSEYSIILNDPRKHSWIASVTNSVYADNALIRPLVFDILSIIAASGMKYRTYNEGTLIPVGPCEPVPASVSPCEEASLIVCKGSADVCCAVLLSQATFQWTPSTGGFNIQPNSSFKLIPAVQDSALSLLSSISSCGARGLAGSLSAIATTGFSFVTSPHQMNLNDPDIDVKQASKEILSTRCAMKDLSAMLLSINSSELVDLVMKDYNWKRPQFFDEVFPILDQVLTNKDNILSYPQLWPIITYCSAFICTLANPETDKTSASLTLDGLKAAVKLPVLEDHSQPVLNDAIAAVFLSIGGGIALSGLIGRFGNLPEHKKWDANEFVAYLFNRGQCRESFWTDWELSHREVEVIDPKTGKPVVKKEEKKGKDNNKPGDKGGKGEVKPMSVVPEVELNLISTTAFPDPNHGPNKDYWLRLLEITVDDLHEKCIDATLLTSLTQGSSSQLAVQLINLGVDVNHCDGTSHTALMYGLLMNDSIVVPALLAQTNLDMLDQDRNSTLKYALLSMNGFDKDHYFSSPHDASIDSVIEVYGKPLLLSLFLDTNIDFNVCDSEGLSAIMIALGRGSLSIKIGGYSVILRNEAYNNPNYGFPEIHEYIVELIKVGTQVNKCNHNGQVPLHISSAKADIICIQTLLDHGAIPNAVDSMGYLPFHYLVACCPENAPSCFDLLFKYSSHRHLETMVFEDYRTGNPEEQKNEYESNQYIKQAFDELINPSVISKKRLTPIDLLQYKSFVGMNMNILQLCFVSHVLFVDNIQLKPFLVLADSKYNRMKLALHLLQIAKSFDPNDYCGLLSAVDDQGLTCIHAASLLFQGITPQIYLTVREINAKRVRKFVSDEAQLLDYLLSYNMEQLNKDVNTKCYHVISSLNSFSPWYPIHAAIIYENPILAQWLLYHGSILEQSEIIHFLAQYNPIASIDLCKVIVHAVVSSSSAQSLLNDKGDNYGLPSRPLHIAVRYGNVNLIHTLASCTKIDLNAIDEDTGYTALYEACISNVISNPNELVKAFLPGNQRIDLFAGYEITFRTPLNVALETYNGEMLKTLIDMRRNDVIFQLLHEVNASLSKEKNQNEDDIEVKSLTGAVTLLIILEEENLKLANLAGINIPPLNKKTLETITLSPIKRGLQENEDDINGDDEEENIMDVPIVANNNDDKDEVDINNNDTTATEQLELDLSTLHLNDTYTDIPVIANNNNIDSLTIEEEQIAQDGFGSKYLEEKKKISTKYFKSNEILRIIIDLVNSSGVVTLEHHIHEYYYEGNLLDE